MDGSNHEMVQMLSQTMGTIFSPLIENTTQANQQMVAQMTCITKFFGVPQPPTSLQEMGKRKLKGNPRRRPNYLPSPTKSNKYTQGNVENQGVEVEQPGVKPLRQQP